MQQADDFLQETEALARAVEGLSAEDWGRETQFRGWTINDVISHLHFWNRAADLSLQDQDGFARFLEALRARRGPQGLRPAERKVTPDLHGTELLEAWLDLARDMAPRWAEADPGKRLPWSGPSMSARSSITARQMETWAHGHEVFDVLGLCREETDRIRNIVVLGVNTYGWTFQTREAPIPGPMPRLRLVAPSGEVWEFGEGEGLIAGSAVGFAQTVTQTRNVADTDLKVEGEAARLWMENAQCFAGAPVQPPAPGARHVQERSSSS